MEYGASILSKQPSDWSIVNGTMSSTEIALNASGSAYIKIKESDMSAVPETMKLIIIAEPFTATYAPTAYVHLRVVTETDTIEYSVPIIDTDNNICSVVIPTTKMSYKELSFSITTQYPITIKDWLLSPPLADEANINLDEVKEEIPKLLADYNTSTFVVGQREEVIALISARLIENTDVNGHLQLTYVASSACTITIRFKDNDGVELFAPILYSVQGGRGSIGVPHAYLKRLLGMHTFVVTAQCSTGSLTFYTRSVLYTLDAGYLAKRTMDVGLIVQDISVCQLPEESSPSSIYAVGIDTDGVARVRRRVYSSNAAIVWEPVYSLTKAKAAAIEFDGDFVLRTDSAFYTLECYEQPYVFWIDTKNDLYVQLGPDEGTRLKLASNASALSAVRGFKSFMYPEQDQGLIVAYIVDGSVYYRNYCMQSDGTYKWEYEKQVTDLGSNNTHIHIHRLNDYRVGFVATNPTGHTWAITTRTYVGSSFTPESVYMPADCFASIAVYKADEAAFSLSVAGSVSDDFTTMYITGNLPLVASGNFYDIFEISSASSAFVSVKDMQVRDGIIQINLTGAPEIMGVLYLRPKPGKLVAYYANHGYIPVPDSDIAFEFTYKYALEETMTMNPSIKASIVQKAFVDIPYELKEDLSMNASMSANISQKCITITPYELSENLSMSCSMTATITQSYTGESPI